MLTLVLLASASAADLQVTVQAPGADTVSFTLPDADVGDTWHIELPDRHLLDVEVDTGRGEADWFVTFQLTRQRGRRASVVVAHPTMGARTGELAEFVVLRQTTVKGQDGIEFDVQEMSITWMISVSSAANPM